MSGARAILLLAAVAGCADGRSVVQIDVDAVAGTVVSGVARFRVTVTNGGQTSDPTVLPLAGPTSLPPAQSFALGFGPERSGEFHLTVEALSASGASLSSNVVTGTIAPSQSLRLRVELPGTPIGDGGIDAMRDATLPDLIGADLTLLPNGTPCTSGGECTSGACVTGVCCALASCPRCTTCAPDGTACTAVAGGAVDPTGSCTSDPALCESDTCTDSGTCQPLSNTTICAPQSCVGSTFTVASTCDGVTAGSCPPGFSQQCPRNFGCNGSDCYGACTTSAECAGGYCCRSSACIDASQPSSCGPQCFDCAGDNSGDACIGSSFCGCNGAGNCPSFRPVCNQASQLCVQCVTNGDCTPAQPRCQGNVCVACKNSNDCNSGLGKTCANMIGACTCSSNLDCTNPRVDSCSGAACSCGATGGPCPVGRTCTGGVCS